MDKVHGAYENYEAEKKEKLVDSEYKYHFVKSFIDGGLSDTPGKAGGLNLSPQRGLKAKAVPSLAPVSPVPEHRTPTQGRF